MAIWENYSEALNTCIDRLNAGENLESILGDYPTMARDLRPMLQAGQLFQRVAYPIADVQAAQARIAPQVQAATGGSFGMLGNYWILLVALIGVGLLSVIVFNFSPMEFSPSAEATDTLEISIVGQISAIHETAIEVNGLSIALDDSAQLNGLVLGDSVEIVGHWQNGSFIALAIATSTPEEDSTPLVTIEGVVEAINGTTIRIYGMEIDLAPDDPTLNAIRIGDMLRVEGEYREGRLLIIHIIFINVDVVINEAGEVWRDSGNCSNPPPAWAVANGWRRRCESSGGNTGGNRSSRRGS